MDWEINVPDWPIGGLYDLPSLKIPILYHTDIYLSDFVFFPSEQDMVEINKTLILEAIILQESFDFTQLSIWL